MPRIRDAVLFASTAPFLPKGTTQRQYLKELAKAKKWCLVYDEGYPSLIGAFFWCASPQGHSFWSTLDDEISEAKRHVNNN